MNKLTLSGSPHVHGEMSVKSIMWGVIIALIPAFLVSCWYFGFNALLITLIAIVSCVGFEYAIQKFVMKTEPSITDGSAVVTGLLLAFNVPSSLPWWQMVIGSLVAIGIAKMSYGGLGKNPFNPALAGRVFMLISFPVDMTSWPIPVQNWFTIDALTGPTSLGILKEGLANGETLSQLSVKLPTYTNLFIGQVGGSLGEVSAAALIIGGIYMLYRKIITWHIPVAYIATTALFTGILWMVNPELYIDPVFHILAGGLLLGAIFMATDMVTSPMTCSGMLVFGIGCGILTVLIRVWGSYPEGVSFAILIMNAIVPLINKGFKPSRFGK
jgi:electron transport complex protein RnfD